jgi:hypothetical protein
MIRRTFYEWLETQTPLAEVQGFMRDPAAYARNIATGIEKEEWVAQQIAKQGFDVKPARPSEDQHSDIDCYINGKATQIKRRTSGGEDLPYEVVKPHDPTKPFLPQITSNPGGGLRGKAELYAILNQAETTVYLVDTRYIKALVMQAAQELRDRPLERKHTAQNGVTFFPLLDATWVVRGGQKLPKVRAYIPIDILQSVGQAIDISEPAAA